MALVSQDVTIFDDTIVGNISLRTSFATEEQITKAAKDAAADEFILAFTTRVSNSSRRKRSFVIRWQRQRISLARAILRDAPFFYLMRQHRHLIMNQSA